MALHQEAVEKQAKERVAAEAAAVAANSKLRGEILASLQGRFGYFQQVLDDTDSKHTRELEDERLGRHQHHATYAERVQNLEHAFQDLAVTHSQKVKVVKENL